MEFRIKHIAIFVLLICILWYIKYSLFDDYILINGWHGINTTQINIPNLAEYNEYYHQKWQSYSIMPTQFILWDSLWIQMIQYIGFDLFREYYTWFYDNIDIITDVSPYWEEPYIFWQLLLPINKHSDITLNTKITSRDEAINIWEKGVSFLCNEIDCKDYRIGSYLWFNYYQYIHDLKNSNKYYHLAANSDNAPAILKQMPAIITSKFWEHIKSAIMRYQQADTIDDSDQKVYLLNKALSEVFLHMIKETDKNQNICIANLQHNLNCLIKNKLIQKSLQKILSKCSTDITDINIKVSCILINYGLENKFIDMDGNLVYPVQPNKYRYERRLDINDRWIVPN